MRDRDQERDPQQESNHSVQEARQVYLVEKKAEAGYDMNESVVFGECHLDLRVELNHTDLENKQLKVLERGRLFSDQDFLSAEYGESTFKEELSSTLQGLEGALNAVKAKLQERFSDANMDSVINAHAIVESLFSAALRCESANQDNPSTDLDSARYKGSSHSEIQNEFMKYFGDLADNQVWGFEDVLVSEMDMSPEDAKEILKYAYEYLNEKFSDETSEE